ncbi:hypothetical protein NKG94_21555 [Micromonospora sp. M12]
MTRCPGWCPRCSRLGFVHCARSHRPPFSSARVWWSARRRARRRRLVARSSYTSTDTGAGTYSVPLLNADVPDISVERVPAAENDEGRDLYYMISTTMHLSRALRS